MTVFIALGRIDYEMDDLLGVLDSFEAASMRCGERLGTLNAEIPYDRYYIEEWDLGAKEFSRRWTRDSDESDWYLFKAAP